MLLISSHLIVFIGGTWLSREHNSIGMVEDHLDCRRLMFGFPIHLDRKQLVDRKDGLLAGSTPSEGGEGLLAGIVKKLY